MKKILCLILTLVCILTGLCGCNLLGKQPVTLADSISIPKNGMIEASVFETLKSENKAVIFKGQSGDIRYEWILFGSDIKEAKDLNLGIEITEADSEKVAFRFLSEESFGFSPILSIYLNDIWEAQSASMYEVSTSDAAKKQEVSITGNKQSILNFSPEVQTGAFVITPNVEQNPTIPSMPVSTSSLDAASSENSDTTQTSKPSNAISYEKPETSQNTNSPDTQFPSAENQKPTVFEPPVESQKPVISEPSAESQKPTVSEPPAESQRPISDGKDTEQDKYKTDPVPEGKPLPVEPDNQEVDTRKTYTCTLSIECTSIFNHLKDLEPEKLDVLPKNGIIFAAQAVAFYEGESVYDVLQRVCRENRIHMEASFTPMYNSAYVEGIDNLYEFDCGSGSGWMYRVDGWYPNYGCSRYQLKQGEKIEWRYTCDLGKDIGGSNAISE